MLTTRSGTVRGNLVRANRGLGRSVRMLQVEISDAADIQSVQLVGPGGEDFNPPVGSRVVILAAGQACKLAVGVDDRVEPTAEAGEKRLYALDENGAAVATIRLRPDGTVEILGAADYAVRFNALKTAFDQLKQDFDLHVHSGVTTGGASSGVPTVASTADIDPAKVETVRLP